jgi:hypothetical protein
MLKGRDQQAEETVQILVGRRRQYLSHGQVVNCAEARDVLHLNIEYLRPDNPIWELIWELYVRSDMFCHQNQQAKILENDSISMGVKLALVGPGGGLNVPGICLERVKSAVGCGCFFCLLNHLGRFLVLGQEFFHVSILF